MENAHDNRKCGGADRCPTCKARVRARYPRVPVIPQLDVGPAPKSIPWRLADQAWQTYDAIYGCGQSMERLVERGGWHWSDFPCLLAGHAPGMCGQAVVCRLQAFKVVERDVVAAERRRIGRLLQDAASAERLGAEARGELLRMREVVLALEDETEIGC